MCDGASCNANPSVGIDLGDANVNIDFSDIPNTSVNAPVRKLDDSVAQAMLVASTPQELGERGKKNHAMKQHVYHLTSASCNANPSVGIDLGDANVNIDFSDIPNTSVNAPVNIYPLVITFEKLLMMLDGSDVNFSYEDYALLAESRSSTSSKEKREIVRKLDDSVAQAMLVASTPQELRERGKKGNPSLMPTCYCDLGEYERAEKIYLYTCGKINAAVFHVYREAAEAYAKGDQFSKCLSVCKKGNLFDKRSLGCLDDLLLLEEESGHVLEAAELARSCGDVSKEADLLEKAGNLKRQ
ncbi:uvrD-like Helicase, ATP-binding domain, P-loop containing nucleoside triphosphate hydrolase [Artemisia annua]|uniref:UvrD-like Helicase, ATP-binding domain, P-loop containing nucleoside triphosphate hydrolase n=1 Tax=Artemisia annua TaxID=35608 RepID=A0A2U1ND02_ARTAN|nr:uvrD-like Helicase, ATP-binding domain, P-loop containing nucleoside triphosphate hydrolase [Artemisia annua]